MKKHINPVGVALFALWLASFAAAAKFGHGPSTFGFFSGG